MLNRREYLTVTAATCAALSLKTRLLAAQDAGVITRPVPSTGEQIPIIGLGSSATFQQLAVADDLDPLRDVFRTLIDAGGTVFDTAPGYGRGTSETVAGRLVDELGIADRVFWATKLNVAGFRGDTPADPDAARAQLEASFERFSREPMDLNQVHNLGDMATQMPMLHEAREQGRLRYVGATTTFKPQYERLEQHMRDDGLDFIGIDYAVDNLDAEDRIFPLAQDQGIAVMVYMPFGRTRLWERVAGQAVPEWAAEFGAGTWAQFFLKFVASHPAVTVITPATSKPHHMLDNMGAALGRLPDEAERQRMIEHIEALPQA